MAADYSGWINYICCVVWIMQLGTICGADTKRNNSGTKGFQIGQFPEDQMFAFECNATHLPKDVSQIFSISLERRPRKGKAQVMATLSGKGGAQLKLSPGTGRVFVSGHFSHDTPLTSRLTLLTPGHFLSRDVTYVCNINTMNTAGGLDIIRRTIHLTAKDIHKFRNPTVPTTPLISPTSATISQETPATPALGSSRAAGKKSTGMSRRMIIMLAVMGSLVLLLFIVCTVLIVTGCAARRKPSQSQSTATYHPRPPASLPPMALPGMTSQGMTSPAMTFPRQSKAKHTRQYSNVKSPDDTGYDTDTMIYNQPWSDFSDVDFGPASPNKAEL